MFTDWSDNEHPCDKYQDKKMKTSKKRRRSVSIERESLARMKKTKNKQKKESERGYDKDTENIRNKSNKRSEKVSCDVDEGKTIKSDNKRRSSVNFDSDNENLRNKKNRTDNKIKFTNSEHGNEDERIREKDESGTHDDYNRQGKNDKSKKHSSRKSKYNSDSENEKKKIVESKKKLSKEKYRETSDSRHPHEKSGSYKNNYDDDVLSNRHDYDSNRDDSDRHGSGSDKPLRYWSFSRGPVRKNSDSYWNKYSDRLKESSEHAEVGPRYYSSGDNEHKGKPDDSVSKVKGREGAEVKDSPNKEMKEGSKEVKAKQQKQFDPLMSRTGGAYIPPAKLKMMQESITDKGRCVYYPESR